MPHSSGSLLIIIIKLKVFTKYYHYIESHLVIIIVILKVRYQLSLYLKFFNNYRHDIER
jgi:hypothetical protein